MKRVFCLFLILTFILVPLVSNAAEESGTFKAINWILDKQGVLKLEGGETIPAEGPWLTYANQIKSIEIGDTITRMDSDALSHCIKLENIVIPASVEVLGNKAFFDCQNLKSLVFLGDHITLNGGRVFGFCKKLQSVVLPAATFQTDKNVARNTFGAFEYCTNLQTFVFSEGTKDIPGNFFIMCKKLKNVYIPTSIEAIDETAFSRDSKNLVIRCIEGSYAETFAIKNGFKYEYYIPVESITLSEIELTLKKGKKASLKQTIEPANITVKDVMWFSTDDDIATVNKGQIKTNGFGECDIICQAMDGSGVRAICHVIVEE